MLLKPSCVWSVSVQEFHVGEMIFKCIRSRSFHTFFQRRFTSPLKNNYSRASLISFESYNNLFLSSRSFSLSAQFVQTSKEKSQKFRKPLSVYFKESVGISENIDCGEFGADENSDLNQKLRILAEEVRSLNNKSHVKHENSVRGGIIRRLSVLFSKREIGEKMKLDPTVIENEGTLIYKELSPDMQTFACFLHEGGYFKGANFIHGAKLDLCSFRESYARQYLVFAAVKFGRDHQEIAKWLSASDLKKVANFGCPSLRLTTVRAAKCLRGFFKIEEVKVCESCVLKESCKLANKRSVPYGSKLHLTQVMRVLNTYAMDSVPQQLVVPEEIKSSVSLLLKEAMGLSKTVP